MTYRKSFVALFRVSVVLLALTVTAAFADAVKGKFVVDKNCAGCHLPGVMGAPKLANFQDWKARAEQGSSVLIDHAINGFKAMPAKGGNPVLSDDQIRDAVDYFLAKADLAGVAAAADKSAAKTKAKAVQATKVSTSKKATAASTDKTNLAKKRYSANQFNRLMKSKSAWNPPPPEDGIHDPDNEGTYILQPPKDAFVGMPSNNFGNHVDWVKALSQEAINPRYDRLDPAKKAFVMDLNIVREVKGSMPDVVYPHKQHTEWLDCSNCHPAIFIPKKGANSISMASILMGEKCGVCHGKVAFPVSECRRCHSKKKAIKKMVK